MDNPICVALDLSDANEATEYARRLKGHVGLAKIGLELFCAAGPQIVESVRDAGLGVFLDLKFCDIPNTVFRAVHAVAGLGVQILNVHALGGKAMMEAAREGAEQGSSGIARPKVVAVTILTSLDDRALQEELGFTGRAIDRVRSLALLAQSAGLDGVVCSAQEAGVVREACGHGFLIITPGIRPAGLPDDDQRRVVTPSGALQAGANVLVVGRPILAAASPEAAADAILAEIRR